MEKHCFHRFFVDNSAALWITFVGWALQALQALINTLEAVAGRKIQVMNAPRREGDPARLVADATLARKQLGWQPQYADRATIVEHAWKWETRGV